MHYSKGKGQQAAVQMQTVSIRSQQQILNNWKKNLKCTIVQWTLIKALLIQLL
jgi:hypothetical protein